jgi:hypothetical protein
MRKTERSMTGMIDSVSGFETGSSVSSHFLVWRVCPFAEHLRHGQYRYFTKLSTKWESNVSRAPKQRALKMSVDVRIPESTKIGILPSILAAISPGVLPLRWRSAIELSAAVITHHDRRRIHLHAFDSILD